jgi:cytoskeleton protein RodZ
MKSIGQQLTEARVERKLTPEAAAKITKIKLERLLELEADDFSKFASPAYARGFVRTYARVLKLDERRILKQLDGVLEDVEESGYVVAPPVEYVPEEIKMVEPLSGQQIGWRVAVAIFVVIVGIVAWNIYRVYPTAENTPPPVAEEKKAEPKTAVPMAKIAPPEPPAPAPVKEEPVTPPVPAPTPVVAPADPNAERKLKLVALEEAWVRVVLVRGEQRTEVLDAILKPGEAREFAAPRFLVKALSPAAFQVIVDEQDRGPLGAEHGAPKTYMLPPP